VVTLTEDIARAARSAYGDEARIVAIPNWPNPPVRPRRESAASGDITVAMITRMSADKGVITALDALALLADRGQHVRCLLVGGGPLIPVLPQLVRERRLEETTEILGDQPVAKVWEVLGEADIFLLPSEDEGMPMAILEAASMGVPVVATPVGGIPEIAKNRVNGLLVPVGDVQALAEAIAELAGDPEKRTRMGEAGKAIWQQNYTEAAVWPRWEALYRSLIAQQGSNTE
jgi:glycosyltransferase involved in cell wall biosynthesis